MSLFCAERTVRTGIQHAIVPEALWTCRDSSSYRIHLKLYQNYYRHSGLAFNMSLSQKTIEILEWVEIQKALTKILISTRDCSNCLGYNLYAIYPMPLVRWSCRGRESYSWLYDGQLFSVMPKTHFRWCQVADLLMQIPGTPIVRIDTSAFF